MSAPGAAGSPDRTLLLTIGARCSTGLDRVSGLSGGCGSHWVFRGPTGVAGCPRTPRLTATGPSEVTGSPRFGQESLAARGPTESARLTPGPPGVIDCPGASGGHLSAGVSSAPFTSLSPFPPSPAGSGAVTPLLTRPGDRYRPLPPEPAAPGPCHRAPPGRRARPVRQTEPFVTGAPLLRAATICPHANTRRRLHSLPGTEPNGIDTIAW